MSVVRFLDDHPAMAVYSSPVGFSPAEYYVDSEQMKSVIIAHGVPGSRVHVVDMPDPPRRGHETHRRIVEGID